MQTESMHITPADGNVFADLGFAPEEAAKLKAQSQRIISVKLALKDSLVSELARWIEERNLQPAQTAEMLGVTSRLASDVINKGPSSSPSMRWWTCWPEPESRFNCPFTELGNWRPLCCH